MFEKPMNIKKPLAMHKTCSECGQPFDPEPGFYYGAMFISYTFIGFLSLGIVGALIYFGGLSVEMAFLILAFIIALIYLWNLRFSRSIWIHMVVRYDPAAINKRKEAA